MNRMKRCFVNSLMTDRDVDETKIKEFVSVGEARRMSKILKRALATSFGAIMESDIERPQAIITGTGMGCMDNSEKFLKELIEYGETSLSPTLFMQSTHNTIGSKIAITLKNNGYNNTYSHKGISFESALLDAWLQLLAGEIDSALVGGFDEVAPVMSTVMKDAHPEFVCPTDVSVSTILTSDNHPKNICEIADIKILHRPGLKELADLLTEDKDNILITGGNGIDVNDEPYKKLLQHLSYSPTILTYKENFGDNFTSPAMAFYSGVNKFKEDANLKHITLLNHSDNINWSLIRLQRI